MERRRRAPKEGQSTIEQIIDELAWKQMVLQANADSLGDAILYLYDLQDENGVDEEEML